MKNLFVVALLAVIVALFLSTSQVYARPSRLVGRPALVRARRTTPESDSAWWPKHYGRRWDHSHGNFWKSSLSLSDYKIEEMIRRLHNIHGRVSNFERPSTLLKKLRTQSKLMSSSADVPMRKPFLSSKLTTNNNNKL